MIIEDALSEKLGSLLPLLLLDGFAIWNNIKNNNSSASVFAMSCKKSQIIYYTDTEKDRLCFELCFLIVYLSKYYDDSYSHVKENVDSLKNMLLLRKEYLIWIMFCNDWAKIVDFLLETYFWVSKFL